MQALRCSGNAAELSLKPFDHVANLFDTEQIRPPLEVALSFWIARQDGDLRPETEIFPLAHVDRVVECVRLPAM